MAEQIKSLEDMIRELPPDLYQEAADFIQFLIEKRARKRTGKLKFDWRGGLREMRGEYTSVELQHKSSEWRNEDVST